jgi:phenylacetate-CoA ligase
MNIRLRLKRAAENLPYSVGKLACHVPYAVRLGRGYNTFSRLANYYEKATPQERRSYTLAKLNHIVDFAQANIPFYQRLYGHAPINIHTLEDFEALPTITKTEVRKYTMESTGAMLINTGGTTGEPLSFYLDKNAWAREWAHMHFIWGLRGYAPTDLMVTMLGKDLGNSLYRYNAVHNEIRINPYLFFQSHAGELFDLFRKLPVKYFQGYPSSTYHFFRELELALDEERRRLISSKIRCLLFSSEFPMPHMVDYLENTWRFQHLSWYGHSEMCVLAYAGDNNLNYRPFVTYGYAENIDGMLHGTSFHNFSMPLIRYATGDLVESVQNDAGMMESFSITEGREGDFVEDKTGRRISLTALVFGRHHEIFNHADYLQISQAERGEVTFYVSFVGEPTIASSDVHRYFDLVGLDFDFHFVFLKNPILTKSGKLKLNAAMDDVRAMQCRTH